VAHVRQTNVDHNYERTAVSRYFIIHYRRTNVHLAAVFTFSRFIFIQDIWYSPRPPLNHSHIKVEKNFRSRPSPPHLHAEKTRPPVKVTEWKHESTTLLIEPGHAARKKQAKHDVKDQPEDAKPTIRLAIGLI